MVTYSNSDYYNMMLCVGAAPNNELTAARRLYQERHTERPLPSYRCFRELVGRLSSTGSFHRSNGGGRPSALSVRDEEAILDYFDEDPQRSTRRAAAQLNVSHMKVWRVLRDDGQHPYHYRRTQELTAADYGPRVQFSRWVQERAVADQSWSSTVLWSDEATFTRSGVSNIHNDHLWAHVNPRASRQSRFQHRWSVNVWAGIIGDRIIGPIILPDRLNGETYLQVLSGQIEDQLEELPLRVYRDLVFQQDGAPAHYSRAVREYLDQRFPMWIGRGGSVAWPPRSPDLTPLDYFLWGFIKGVVYASECDTAEEMRSRVVQACAAISPAFIKNATSSVVNRARLCCLQDGRHIEPFL